MVMHDSGASGPWSCGLTSDCSKPEDAEAELNLLFECEIPTIGIDGQPEEE